MSVRILIGDVRDRLAELPDNHFDCVVTSPPYWGLRDYDAEGQIGLEPTLGEHLAVMVDVMREVRRVLKPTGTLWLNYGDCYATSPNGRSAADTKRLSPDDRTFRDKPFSTVGPIYASDPRDEDRRGSCSTLEGPQTLHTPGRIVAGGTLKPKDLCMVPNRLAIALQDDGWWVRSEIIWGKLNPMPESIRDRPATAHEKIWLLTKSARYYYDGEAVRMPAAPASGPRWAQDVDEQRGSDRQPGKTNGTMKAVGGPRRNKQAASAASAGASSGRRMAGFNERWNANENARGFRGGSYVGGKPGPRTETGNVPGTGDRNLRNYEPAPLIVWPMGTEPFKDAHFATFPTELALRCLRAGCPLGGRVLDPFGGAGTVGLVADRLGLEATLIELNPAYASLAERRIASDAGMFAVVEVA